MSEPLHRPLPAALLQRFALFATMSGSAAKQWLWAHYCSLTCAERAKFVKDALNINEVTTVDVESLPAIFGHAISHDRHTLPHPNPAKLCAKLHGSVLLRTDRFCCTTQRCIPRWSCNSTTKRRTQGALSRSEGEPSWLVPEHVYRLEIDLWATATSLASIAIRIAAVNWATQ